MSGQHTPGPWSIVPADTCSQSRSDYVGISAEKWRALADVPVAVDGAPSSEGQANARLIAAAPDLLEALKEAHRALMHYEWYANPKSGWASDENTTVRGMVDAAIAKATGGQP